MTEMVTVLLPTYNEAGNISPLIREILREVERPIEIIVIDDDSPDDTWRMVAGLARKDDRIRLVHRKGERGLTSALREGIVQARGEIVVWMDCDFSHPPSMIPRLLQALDKGADMVVSSRYVAGGADQRDERLHRILSRIITTAASLALDRSFRDYTSGFVAVRREVLTTNRLEGDYGEYFIRFIYQAIRQGYRAREIPFVNVSRGVGESKTATSLFGFARRGRKYIWTILGLALVDRVGRRQGRVRSA